MGEKRKMSKFDNVAGPSDIGSFAAYDTVKELILEKRYLLTEAYDRYIEVTKERNFKSYFPGWVRWIKALNSLYLEIRPKIKKENYSKDYKETIQLMDYSLKGNKKLTETEAIDCTLHLIDFCEIMGVTDIMFERPDKGRAILR